MPCPSCPLCSGAPKTRHFTSYKHTTDHALLTPSYTLVADSVYCDYDPIKKKADIGSNFLERD